MRKRIVWIIGVVVGLGWLVHWFANDFVLKPHFTLFTVLIQTPGGPVPIGITFYDGDTAGIQVGNRDPEPERMLFTAYKDFRVIRFDRGSSDFKIEFPQSQTTLVMRSLSDGKRGGDAEGTLIIHGRDGESETLQAKFGLVDELDWCGDTAEPTEPPANFGGIWQLDLTSSVTDGMIYIDDSVWTYAHAELLVFETEHRSFSGIVTGDRIRLASFDNAYPALILATIQDDGTLKGDLWVGDRLHESFVGTRE